MTEATPGMIPAPKEESWRDGKCVIAESDIRFAADAAIPVEGYRLEISPDEGRHFFGKETVKGLLDRLADYKFNVFHWHLADDQGWRLAIDRFPELARYGSVRPESAVHGCRGNPEDYRGNGQPYGPYFYTAADVREFLAYAKERFITMNHKERKQEVREHSGLSNGGASVPIIAIIGTSGTSCPLAKAKSKTFVFDISSVVTYN